MRTKTVRTDRHTDRHTPMTTIPDGLRRAGNNRKIKTTGVTHDKTKVNVLTSASEIVFKFIELHYVG